MDVSALPPLPPGEKKPPSLPLPPLPSAARPVPRLMDVSALPPGPAITALLPAPPVAIPSSLSAKAPPPGRPRRPLPKNPAAPPLPLAPPRRAVGSPIAEKIRSRGRCGPATGCSRGSAGLAGAVGPVPPVLGHCASAHGVKRKGHSDQGRAAVRRRRNRCRYAAADERVGCRGGAVGPVLGHCASAHGVKRKGHSDQGRAAVRRRRNRCRYAAADERVGCRGGAVAPFPPFWVTAPALTALNAKVTPIRAGPLFADAVTGADTPPPMSELGAAAAPSSPRSGSLRQRSRR